MNKYFILILIIAQCIYANKKIIINGNNLTKDYVILDVINQDDSIPNIENDKNNLLALEIFEEVFIESNDSLYIINVIEKPQIITFPLIDRNESLGWSYGIKLHLNNINGENKKLKFNLSTGAIGSGSIIYEQPSFYNNHKLSGEIFKRHRTDIEDNYLLDESQLNINYIVPLYIENASLKFTLSYYNNQLDYIEHNNLYDIHGQSFSAGYSRVFSANKYKNIFNSQLTFYDFNKFLSYQFLDLHNSFIYKISSSNNIFLLVRNQLSIYSIANIPIYQQLYIGGEDGVRSFEQKPSLNNIAIQNQLVANNIFLTTIQLQIPFYDMNGIQSDLLLFVDYGIGSDYYKHFDLNNKISGKGFGIRFNVTDQGEFDICIGTNQFGEKILHFIVNI